MSKTTAFRLDMGIGFQAIAREKRVDGVISRKYRKELIRLGKYVKDDSPFEITELVLSNWVKQFHRMKRNGVRVPIPNTHDDDGDTSKNCGWVLDLFVEGESLFMVCDLIGEDAITSAAKADVSVYCPLNFTDGTGNEYEYPITHVAMCTHPVIPGLSEFIPLAASLKLKENKMDAKKISKALKLELDGDKSEDQFIKAFTELKASFEGEQKKRKDIEKERDELLKKEPTGNEEKPATPDPMLLSLAADNRNMKLAALVSAGRITPSVSEKLQDLFIGEDNKALVLSLQTGTHGNFDKLILALSENDPVQLNEQTGPQLFRLRDSLKDDKQENLLIADAENRSKNVKKVS